MTGSGKTAAFALPILLEALGCTVVRLHTTPDGTFPRGAEPLPENLTGKYVIFRLPHWKEDEYWNPFKDINGTSMDIEIINEENITINNWTAVELDYYSEDIFYNVSSFLYIEGEDPVFNDLRERNGYSSGFYEFFINEIKIIII